MVRTIALALAGAALVLGTLAAPAGAIETETFGIDVVENRSEGRLRIRLEAGKTTAGELRVWNKHDGPLVLRLSVTPASVDDDGTASLGGDPEPVRWVSVPTRVELAAGEERRVTVRVAAPRQLSAEPKTVAVLAQAEPAAGGDEPAVLQRLAVTTYLVPDEGSLVASLGWLPWIAAAALTAVVAALTRRAVRRRRGPQQA